MLPTASFTHRTLPLSLDTHGRRTGLHLRCSSDTGLSASSLGRRRRAILLKMLAAVLLWTGSIPVDRMSGDRKPVQRAAASEQEAGSLRLPRQPHLATAVIAAGFSIPADQFRPYAQSLEGLGMRVDIFQDGSSMSRKLTIFEGASKLISTIEAAHLERADPGQSVFLVGHSRGCKQVGEDCNALARACPAC